MTTPLRTDDKLAIAAARLKRAAPNAFKEVVDLLDAHAREGMALCVQAPPDQVLGKQGKAQEAIYMRDLFNECIATAEKLEAKLKGAT